MHLPRMVVRRLDSSSAASSSHNSINNNNNSHHGRRHRSRSRHDHYATNAATVAALTSTTTTTTTSRQCPPVASVAAAVATTNDAVVVVDSWMNNKNEDNNKDHDHAAAAAATVWQYHESARSIVFRDHLRRSVRRRQEGGKQQQQQQQQKHGSNNQSKDNMRQTAAAATTTTTYAAATSTTTTTRESSNQVSVQPLPRLALGPEDVFEPLLTSTTPVTDAERDVVERIHTQKATVKTIKANDWTAFLQHFHHVVQQAARPPRHCHELIHDDCPPPVNHTSCRYASFVTSTTLLPPNGCHMRCFGSETLYTVGAVFAWPNFATNDNDENNNEQKACQSTQTWAWPSGYAAKTEHNIDTRTGRLINGRQQALVTVQQLRQYNLDYQTKSQYFVAGKLVPRMTTTTGVPYNEVYLRVGGVGRIVQGQDVETKQPACPTLQHGVGLPIALFCRRATFGHLITLLRKRARYAAVLGEAAAQDLPLLLITPTLGVRVFTKTLQEAMWKVAAAQLNPFQSISTTTTTRPNSNDDMAVDQASFQQKVDELLHLDASIRAHLTPAELARIAGGFGATDQSVASLLYQVVIQEYHDRVVTTAGSNGSSHHHGDAESTTVDSSNTSGGAGGGGGGNDNNLQHVVTEGLTAAVRAGDYHTSRQLLILYSLVAGCRDQVLEDIHEIAIGNSSESQQQPQQQQPPNDASDNTKQDAVVENVLIEKYMQMVRSTHHNNQHLTSRVPAPPPPPPLDTDRLRSATNSDGLLAVLGAAQILKALQDGTAQTRTEEAILAVEEWVDYGENSMAFRISSWYDQRAAQGDLRIAMEQDSKFMAFVSTRAISNRRNFAKSLREAVESTNFTDGRFLLEIAHMISKMSRPCLRLELLQYVLGLDNRFSIAHVARSVELAATCLGIRSAGNEASSSETNRSALPVWLGVNP